MNIPYRLAQGCALCIVGNRARQKIRVGTSCGKQAWLRGRHHSVFSDLSLVNRERDGRGFEIRSSRFTELRTQNFELQIALFPQVSLFSRYFASDRM